MLSEMNRNKMIFAYVTYLSDLIFRLIIPFSSRMMIIETHVFILTIQTTVKGTGFELVTQCLKATFFNHWFFA